MANASADKFKLLALRHGEKAVMTLTTVLCLLFLYWSITKPTITLSPDDLQKAAQQSESNLNRQQKPDDILKTIEAQGIKNPGFETIVDQQQNNLLVAADFRTRQLWVTPEPGAGLIRDAPVLIAANELYAYPGRGGALLYYLNPETGQREVDPDAGKTQDEEKEKRRARGRTSARKRGEEERKKKEAEEKRKLEEKQKNAAIAGTITAKKEETPAEGAPAEGPMKEITKGVRWVAITGVLNNKILRDNYLSALKRPEIAYPHFKQLDIERQVKQPDGTWTDWEAIDLDRNRQILDNLPEEDEEWTPETVRIGALVAPLPFLKAGYWERVHVARMVPKEKLEVPKIVIAAGGEGGGSDVMPAPPPVSDSRPMADSSVGPMPMPMYGAGGPEDISFEKTDADEIMIRALDFTVDPDTTYRFRIRIVVYNPNREREDVSPGVDTKSIELFGPWSEPTEEVTMPSDVATYAMAKPPSVPRKLDQVSFQVASWTPDDGVTVVKPFDASPGEIIGEYASAPVPAVTKDGKKEVKSKRVDFNSHRVVLDVIGGDQPMPPLGPGTGGRLFSVPVVTLLVRPDGAVVVRTQANDIHDQVRKDMWDNYNRARKEAEEEEKKKKKPGSSGT